MGRPQEEIDWYLDHPAGPSTVRLRRKAVIRVAQPRQRWRITLDELCYTARISPTIFDIWATSGYLGSRLTSVPDKGRGRHITRATAQRTVLVSRLVAAGMRPEVAGHVVAGHRVGDTAPLEAELPNGVTVTVARDDLP
jgi:hypothetical protein